MFVWCFPFHSILSVTKHKQSLAELSVYLRKTLSEVTQSPAVQRLLLRDTTELGECCSDGFLKQEESRSVYCLALHIEGLL